MSCEKKKCCNQDPCIHTVAPELFEKPSPGKAREFWIGASISGWMATETFKAYSQISPNPAQAIHVIEYSAFKFVCAQRDHAMQHLALEKMKTDQLEAELAEAKQTLREYEHECETVTEMRSERDELKAELDAMRLVADSQLNLNTELSLKLEELSKRKHFTNTGYPYNKVNAELQAQCQKLAAEVTEWKTKALDVENHPVVSLIIKERDAFRSALQEMCDHHKDNHPALKDHQERGGKK